MGIPVITLDTDEPGSSRLVYVGTDNYKAGRQMGELIVQASGGQGHIGVLIGDEQAPNQQHRLEGFRSVISHHPGLTIAEVRSSHISRLQAASQTEEMLLRHSQIRYLVGFSALDGLGMLEGVKRVPEQELHIFAFDDLEETIDGIAQGKIKASIVQQPYEMGYAAVLLLQDYFDGKALPEHRFTSAYMLDQSTVHEASGADGP
ncbi:D-ribose-binding periplasmic protein precursor [compost metagenome]